MSENRDRASYTAMTTTKLAQVDQFLRQNAEKLGSHQIVIRKKRDAILAECFDADEPAT
jgi:hypothetical protein